ncbi:hypothetical protein RHG00_17675 [Clostridioides difficile]|nr:hypothetical protein [Clostridioides difficile]MDE3415221.1 hypothetical protein [Clostridioides difficile]MDE3691754.1 hypothetical protein [Clostridioides difficile]MDI2911484.1 hypothetical protein [Clostridioides difficile]MDI2974808.1 hypothetical protein [Clostridioides difficile]MDO0251171.1 hypothetical protein [Clostridioides difficile]
MPSYEKYAAIRDKKGISDYQVWLNDAPFLAGHSTRMQGTVNWSSSCYN